jgi:signal transduction histidine kinase
MKKYFYLKNVFPVYIIWALLSGLFSLFFILAKESFESPEIKEQFLLSWLIALVSAAVVAFFNFGGFKIIFGINIGHREPAVINSSIVNSHIDTNISDDNLKEIFYVLKKNDYFAFKITFFYAGLVVIINTLIMFFAGTSTYNLVIILIGGFLGIILLALLVMFAIGKYLSGFLRESERMLKDRGIKPEEVKQFISLKDSFYYFSLLFIIIIIVVLSFIPSDNFYLLGLIFAGFVMILIVARAIFVSILSVFEEISEFADKLPKEKETAYFTGSYYSEVSGLAKDLTASAVKIHDARVIEKKAHEDLRELDESKTQFILATEHHLRTPLTIVKGYVDTVLDKKNLILDEETKSYLNKVKDATARVTDLVNELLEISQMEVGKSILKMESVNIKELIMNIINNSKSDIGTKQIKPVFYFPEEDNTLNLNKEKMTEALSNLVSNAIKYNKTVGEIKITGKIIAKKNSQKFYQLTIEDQGIGIKPENISKIFTQYFERGEEARKVYATGRGIGLVIAKNIVKAHLGTIRAESDGEGKGSRFIIELPM